MVRGTSAAGVPRPAADQTAVLLAVVVSVPVPRTRDRATSRARAARGGGGRRGRRRGRLAGERNSLGGAGRRGRRRGYGGRGGARGRGDGRRRAALDRVADAAGRTVRIVADDRGRDEVLVQQGAVDVEAI